MDRFAKQIQQQLLHPSYGLKVTVEMAPYRPMDDLYAAKLSHTDERGRRSSTWVTFKHNGGAQYTGTVSSSFVGKPQGRQIYLMVSDVVYSTDP